MADESLTRGERNNNPCNIDFHPDIAYRGQLGIENVLPGHFYKPRFAMFDTPVNGIRAAARNLLVYYLHHQLRTPRELISRWAPANENDTHSYITAVCAQTGYDPDQPLTLNDTTTLYRLVRAIIQHENGRCIYSPSTISDAVKLALAA